MAEASQAALELPGKGGTWLGGSIKTNRGAFLIVHNVWQSGSVDTDEDAKEHILFSLES